MGVRSYLAASATAAVAAAVVVVPPTPVPPRPDTPVSVARVDLAAAATPLPPADRTAFSAARDALTRLDPVSPLAAVPAPLNAASNTINSAYQWIQGWVDYGVELTQYVLQFIPYGYLIGDQVGIVYYNLVRPISDSVVYDFIDPVVNNPLNIWSYVNGAVAVGSTTVTALINTGIAEFNYFFGWLIPPLPPLPLAAEVAPEPQLRTLATAEAQTTPEQTAEPEHTVEPETAPATTPAEAEQVQKVQQPEAAEQAEQTEKAEQTEAAEKVEKVDEPTKPTVDAKDGVSAQGEIRTGGQTVTTDPTEPEASTKSDGQPSDATTTTQPTTPTASVPGPDPDLKDATKGASQDDRAGDQTDSDE